MVVPNVTRAALSARECEILTLVANGRASSEISGELGISVKTVETHRRNIVWKTGLHGTAALTKFAIREGLTTVEPLEVPR